MPAANNPFPGMNPYLEEFWHDVHPRLLMLASNQLQRALPRDLKARLEQHLSLLEEGAERGVGRRADVAIVEPWSEETDRANPLLASTGVAVAEPVLLELDPPTHRFLQIVDTAGHIVTIIEFLSLGNKTRAEDRAGFAWKRRQIFESGISFVEVDLLLQGEPVLEADGCETLRLNRAAYHVAIHSTHSATLWRLYPIRLRERLPAVEIPLRPSDRPVALDLQPLIDDAIRDGAYDHLDYRRDPTGILSSEDRAWLDGNLREQELRT